MNDIKSDSCHQIDTSKYIKPATGVLDVPLDGTFISADFNYGTGASCDNLVGVDILKRTAANLN